MVHQGRALLLSGVAVDASSAASGRRVPAARPSALRDLVQEHLRKFPGTAFTPHQVGKALTRSAGAVAAALDQLVSLGFAVVTAYDAARKSLSAMLAVQGLRARAATAGIVYSASSCRSQLSGRQGRSSRSIVIPRSR